jgi:hypothetical protein
MSSTLLLAAIVAGCTKDSSRAKTDSAAGAIADSASHAAVDSAASLSVPPGVAAVGTHAEDLYDQVKAGSWDKARALVDSLDAAAKSLPPKESRIQDERAKLTGVIDSLRRAVDAKNKTVALETSNRATYLAARMTEPYHPVEPSAVPLLDYYGRELEVWSAQGNKAKLASTVTDLKSTWSGLRPKVEANNGGPVAKKTDSLVTLIVAARTPAAQAKLATPFLDVVDELEKVFVKQ